MKVEKANDDPLKVGALYILYGYSECHVSNEKQIKYLIRGYPHKGYFSEAWAVWRETVTYVS